MRVRMLVFLGAPGLLGVGLASRLPVAGAPLSGPAAATLLETGVVALASVGDGSLILATKSEPGGEAVFLTQGGRPTKRIPLGAGQVVFPAAGGGYYVKGTGGRVTLVGPTGLPVRSFRIGLGSVALGMSGRLYVGETGGDNFGRIYGPTGAFIGSFGSSVSRKTGTKSEKDTLNSGLVTPAPRGGFYFVTRFRPEPMAYRFSDDGEVAAQFTVNGSSIELQRPHAEGSLARRSADSSVGGVNVISAVAVDPVSEHLWVAVPASTETGVLVEYSPKGAKIAEYQLRDSRGEPILMVEGLALDAEYLYLVSGNKSLYRYARRDLSRSARMSQALRPPAWFSNKLLPSSYASGCPTEPFLPGPDPTFV